MRLNIARIQQAIKEALGSIVVGLVLTAIFGIFADYEDPTLRNLVLLIRLICIVGGTWASIKYFTYADITYLIGWIIGSLLFIDVLETLDIVVNIIIPVVILLSRLGYFVWKSVNSY